MPVVLYGCETWLATLRGERRLRVFESRVLRTIFGPRRVEVTEDWRKLNNEELNGMYCSPNIMQVIKWRRMCWAGHVARLGERRIHGFNGKPEGNIPLGRPRCRLEDNIKMDLRIWDLWIWTGCSWLSIGRRDKHL